MTHGEAKCNCKMNLLTPSSCVTHVARPMGMQEICPMVFCFAVAYFMKNELHKEGLFGWVYQIKGLQGPASVSKSRANIQ